MTTGAVALAGASGGRVETGVPGGYAGRVLRVDLGRRRVWPEPWTPEVMRACLGGAGLGAKVLWDEVPARAGWDHPENRLVLATGPFAGLPVWGTGGLSVVTRGALTNGATSTQANGFFGANLKYSGYDAIVIQGRAPRWVYLYVHDDVVELRDAAHLAGKDTWETQDALSEETGRTGHLLSVYSIGLAGERLVRFAAIQGDYGHVASKNGCGAVMGAKRLKAVAIVRGSRGLQAADPRGLFAAADDIAHDLRINPAARTLYEYGTLPGVVNLHALGALPIRNYTTNVPSPDVDMKTWEAPVLRAAFEHRGHQCSACGMHHCHMQVLPSGRHAGEIVDEPEYEGWSANWTIGVTDRVAASWLNTRVDRACVDINEFGWLCGWVMECQEKGYITEQQLGFRLQWGDAEGANRLLDMINRREGLGDLLAEGTKVAAERIGGAAQDCAIYTGKGAAPRGHDHRARWEEMLDTCTGSTGTLETGPPVFPTELGLPARINPFDAEQVARQTAALNGRRNFEDSLGACIFTTRTLLENLCRALSAATGWQYTREEAMRFGKRVAATFRAFNIVRCGLGPELEFPSRRYGSTPVDGPAKGQAADRHWEQMLDVWYAGMGYDRETGRPTAETLRALGLEEMVHVVWGGSAAPPTARRARPAAGAAGRRQTPRAAKARSARRSRRTRTAARRRP